MNDFRESLIDRMIKIYGYEHRYVIQFAKMCEKYPFNKKFGLKISPCPFPLQHPLSTDL